MSCLVYKMSQDDNPNSFSFLSLRSKDTRYNHIEEAEIEMFSLFKNDSIQNHRFKKIVLATNRSGVAALAKSDMRGPSSNYAHSHLHT